MSGVFVRLFAFFLLGFSVCFGSSIETLGDFQSLATKEGYRASLSLLRSKGDAAAWIQKGYDGGKFDTSIAEYIPQKLSDAVAGHGLFANAKKNVSIKLSADPGKVSFSGANWNALTVVNYIAAVYYDIFSLKNELGQKLFSCEGVEKVCDKLRGEYIGFASQIDAAKRDIKVYAEHLHLYDFLEQMVAIKSETRGTADGVLLAPGVMGKFDENSKSGHFDVFASVGGKDGKREVLRRVVENGVDKGYLRNTEKDSWKYVSLDSDMMQNGAPLPSEYKFDNDDLKVTLEKTNATTNAIETVKGDKHKPYLQALGVWEYYGSTEKTELSRIETPLKLAIQEPPKAPTPMNDGLKINGLPNLGCTCYFNATMQGLHAIPSFRKLIEGMNRTPTSAPESWFPSKWLSNLFAFIERKEGATYNCDIFLKEDATALKSSPDKPKFADEMKKFVDQDAEELFATIIGAIEEECKKIGKKKLFDDTMTVGTVRNMICRKCKKNWISGTITPHTDIKLIVKESGEKTVQNLDSALQDSVVVEYLPEYRCDKDEGGCGETECIDSKTLLKTLPKVLMVHLKRFKQLNTVFRDSKDELKCSKIDSFVDYPEIWPVDSLEGKKDYKLVSVIQHSGTLGGGHYVTNVLGDKGEWWRADDDKAFRLGDGSFKPEQNAYILFYEQIA
ncbi:MAG: ubiquitin carboxyl-terminal hydrolase [Alphaproteobacteria bacterium]|nr:ubiquitin carboxyl-terminal hydrolase [Alphaproteobacteria bacterium]